MRLPIVLSGTRQASIEMPDDATAHEVAVAWDQLPILRKLFEAQAAARFPRPASPKLVRTTTPPPAPSAVPAAAPAPLLDLTVAAAPPSRQPSVALEVRIMRELESLSGGPVNAPDLAELLDASSATVSTKLAELAREGRLTRQARGLYALPQAPIPPGAPLLTQAEALAQVAAMNATTPAEDEPQPGNARTYVLIGGIRHVNDNVIPKMREAGYMMVQEILNDGPQTLSVKAADLFVVLTDFCSHGLFDMVVAEARRRRTPVVKSPHKWSRLRQALAEQFERLHARAS